MALAKNQHAEWRIFKTSHIFLCQAEALFPLIIISSYFFAFHLQKPKPFLFWTWGYYNANVVENINYLSYVCPCFTLYNIFLLNQYSHAQHFFFFFFTFKAYGHSSMCTWYIFFTISSLICLYTKLFS